VPVALRAVAVLVVLALGIQLLPRTPTTPPVVGRVAAASSKDTVTILAGSPSSIDPAHHGDLESATLISQLFESLTAVDSAFTVRPALAASWSIEQGGRRVVFTMRDGLTFSDGTSLTATDVVHSWRRLFTPGNVSPLASLIADVQGARPLLAGTSTDTSTLGVRADGPSRVVVTLDRGGRDLPAIVAGAPFSIVPASVGDAEISLGASGLVGSGGYLLSSVASDAIVLTANGRYWAGRPAIGTVRMASLPPGCGGSDLCSIDAFTSGDVDVAPIGSLASGWIAFDHDLGPSLRTDPSLSVTYYGFDLTRRPFSDARVRRAFAMAVDWRRFAALDGPGSSTPATGMVPASIPGTPGGDFLPSYDPAGARALLAEAGYPGGAGLSGVTFVGDGQFGDAIVTMLKQNLGVTLDYGTMDPNAYSQRLQTALPQLWNLSWSADYPGPNDFLGVLLGTGSTANLGGFSDARFDAEISNGLDAATPADATAAWAKAMAIVRDEVPVVPLSYDASYSLVRNGLLGASQDGLGIIRLAGLAWR
jgi:ABC-type transport system substrate-binding protein